MKDRTPILIKLVFLTIIVVAASAPACNPTTTPPPTCDPGADAAPSGDCWFGDCRLENAQQLYPNPVQKGGTVKLDMSCGAATRDMKFVSTSIRVYICNMNGQTVSNFTVGPFPPNSSIQQIPIWSNVNVAAGTYLVTVVADLGPCGTKKLVSNVKIVVV
jgi:hypothetical protein